jgi:hypothetical protein
MPRHKCKSIAALQIALGGLPDKMRVEVDPNIRVSAKTVGELRKMTAWAENLVIKTPQEPGSESAVERIEAISRSDARIDRRAMARAGAQVAERPMRV